MKITINGQNLKDINPEIKKKITLSVLRELKPYAIKEYDIEGLGDEGYYNLVVQAVEMLYPYIVPERSNP